jgi:hypothetical protein
VRDPIRFDGPWAAASPITATVCRSVTSRAGERNARGWRRPGVTCPEAGGAGSGTEQETGVRGRVASQGAVRPCQPSGRFTPVGFLGLEHFCPGYRGRHGRDCPPTRGREIPGKVGDSAQDQSWCPVAPGTDRRRRSRTVTTSPGNWAGMSGLSRAGLHGPSPLVARVPSKASISWASMQPATSGLPRRSGEDCRERAGSGGTAPGLNPPPQPLGPQGQATRGIPKQRGSGSPITPPPLHPPAAPAAPACAPA